jgi:hypothetical protein
MDPILPAYKPIGERRYRETSRLYWEDFRPGDIFEHRPGRTILEAVSSGRCWCIANAHRKTRQGIKES